jgi:hypothetical protein
MFIATHFINLECALSYMIIPDIYNIYLEMICTMMLLMIFFKCIKNLGLYLKTKKKLKFAYKYLSRTQLALLLSGWWQADKMIRCKNKTQRRIHQEGLNKKNYCTRMYASTKSPLRSNVCTKVWAHGYIILQVVCDMDTCCQGLSGFVRKNL